MSTVTDKSLLKEMVNLQKLVKPLSGEILSFVYPTTVSNPHSCIVLHIITYTSLREARLHI